MDRWVAVVLGLAAVACVPLLARRLRLSRAKHPSLAGHARVARWAAKLVPYYGFDERSFFATDGAPDDVVNRRRAGLAELERALRDRFARTLEAGASLLGSVSDVDFVGAYRVPFQYREVVRRRLPVPLLAEAAEGARLRDLDGRWSYDLTGAYGVNLLGMDFYKRCIERGAARVAELGPVLGPYHPVVADNAQRLKRVSGLDEVSFHMSGTEAVMQAVRLARYHTGRSHVVRFCGAYHGWWGGVQAGVGNPRPAREVYTLRDMDDRSLEVLASRRNIACVLVNPLQALHPNGGAAGDSTLVTGERRAGFDREAYARWLIRLREVCTRRSIPLIFDEVFMGFRLAPGGAQEYFGVRADLATYGKTLGGGLPVGVVCGRGDLMRRYRDDQPANICFARGTFNSHPYVMGAMNEFLRWVDEPGTPALYARAERDWPRRAEALNGRLVERGLPVRVAGVLSVWTTLYTAPGRYHWMLQYYLRAQGLTLPWTGTGRFIFSHLLPEADFESIAERFVAAAEAMQRDGWWWRGEHLTARWIRRRVVAESAAALAGRWAPGGLGAGRSGHADSAATNAGAG